MARTHRRRGHQNHSTMAGFALDLERIGRQQEADIALVRRVITLAIHDNVTVRTPVDLGRARFSWAVSDDQPGTHLPPPGRYSGKGPIYARFRHPYALSYVTSNIPYIVRLEFGWSRQAPNGMARIAVAEVAAGAISAGIRIGQSYRFRR